MSYKVSAKLSVNNRILLNCCNWGNTIIRQKLTPHRKPKPERLNAGKQFFDVLGGHTLYFWQLLISFQMFAPLTMQRKMSTVHSKSKLTKFHVLLQRGSLNDMLGSSWRELITLTLAICCLARFICLVKRTK